MTTEDRERGEVAARLENMEKEVDDLRKFKHAANSQLMVLEFLKSRIDRSNSYEARIAALERQGAVIDTRRVTLSSIWQQAWSILGPLCVAGILFLVSSKGCRP